MSGRSLQTGSREAASRYGAAGDGELVSQIRARDIDAFEELYRRYRSRLTRFLLKLVHRPHLVEEVMNDTLMVVWERADSFNGTSKLSTWIFAIAYRKAMKALRSQDEPVEDKAADERVSSELSPEEAIGRESVRAVLLQAIAELSPDHRAVVELTYFHDMGYREIADIMGCPVDTVKTRMFHARRRLRRLLAGELPDWL